MHQREGENWRGGKYVLNLSLLLLVPLKWWLCCCGKPIQALRNYSRREMRSKGLWSLRKQLELLCLLFDDDLPVETSIKRAIGASFQPKAWDVWNQETGEMDLWGTINKTLWQGLLLGTSLQAPSSHITRQLVTWTFWKSHIISLTSHIWQWWPVNVGLVNKMELWSWGCQSSWSSIRCSPCWEHLTSASISFSCFVQILESSQSSASAEK